ncbi:oxygenase MpaB family protein [Amantichitinum ursilacus]|uniref:Latex clearing protein n=1 Tax=Amantichitinum ursilacus TaxID=857265 RepID=A0A0N0GQP1_9NEIS|nr:oxygenase MpaB family protein [Amantichitinum ursilacus]KPC55060.1 Latex clearing protein precursor [Amantichitinum ursilacus]
MSKPIWSDAALDALKQTGDPLADDCMAALIAHGESAHANAVLSQMETDAAWPDDIPPELRAYLDATAGLPASVDMRRIESAQAFFTAFGIQFGVSLLCRSLPVLYAGKKGGAQVLASTGKLTNQFQRRASETLRFILNAAEPGGLNPGGKGLLTIRKVRLMHAAIRFYAKRTHGWPAKDWPAEWGEPVNQEELVGTMLAFSLEAVAGLRAMGVKVSKQQEEDQLYLWKTIGLVLGIVPQAMPRHASDGNKIWKALGRRNFGPSEAGRMLTQSHVAFLQENLPHEMRGLVPDLMVQLLGRKVAAMLGLRASVWWDWLIDLARIVFRIKSRLADSSHTVESFMGAYGQRLMEALQKYWAGPNAGRPFQIPDQPLHPVLKNQPETVPAQV